MNIHNLTVPSGFVFISCMTTSFAPPFVSGLPSFAPACINFFGYANIYIHINHQLAHGIHCMLGWEVCNEVSCDLLGHSCPCGCLADNNYLIITLDSPITLLHCTSVLWVWCAAPRVRARMRVCVCVSSTLAQVWPGQGQIQEEGGC